MWSRPTESARRNRSPKPCAGLAWRRAMTVEAWLTVTSSRTPSAAMTMPASTRPSSERPWTFVRRSEASSEAKPVMWARSVKRTARATVSERQTAVPRAAAIVFGPIPCASAMVTSMTASAPTTATASGERPSRMAGTTKSRTTARLRASPARARRPRQRPSATTANANASASQSSGWRRSKSARAYSWKSGPVARRASTVAQRREKGSRQGTSVTAATTALSVWTCGASGTRSSRLPFGRRITKPTAVASTSTARAARQATPVPLRVTPLCTTAPRGLLPETRPLRAAEGAAQDVSQSPLVARREAGDHVRGFPHPLENTRAELDALRREEELLHPAIANARPPFHEPPLLETVDEPRYIGGVAVECPGEVVHGQRLLGLEQAEHVSLDRGEVELGHRGHEARLVGEGELHEQPPRFAGGCFLGRRDGHVP